MSIKGGSTVLHYRIERRLGTGGMGEVYLAHDTKLDQPVAIKFLTSHDDERARRRLLNEAKAAAALRDEPGICTVYEVGTDPEHGDFVVMQYVEGEVLSDRLRRGRLDLVNALEVGAGIAAALAAAHAKRIIHRDLKPQNVIITPSGRPVLLDFGLAKRALSGKELDEAKTTAALTKPYSMIGTPGYMSPEQIRQARVDQRSDLFALGCVLYECLTGRRAFPGPTAADAIGQVLHTEPAPVSSVVPDVAAGVDALCARLLQKDVRQRFQSADEAFGAIRALLPASSGVVSGSTTSKSRSIDRSLARTTAIAAAVLIAAVSGAWWLWGRAPRLHVPSPGAQTWFDKGVIAIREGAYAGARLDFEEAVKIDSNYVQAYARLADARIELDDQRGAQSALLRVSQLVPNHSDLPNEDRLRLEAVTASVISEHDKAIGAYRGLVQRSPKDAPSWLDLGRAQEAAYRLNDARDSFKKAVQLDSQYSAAYTRLGLLQVTPRTEAIGYLNEALRLARTAGDVEGENEALLRMGVVLSSNGQHEEAHHALERVIAQTADSRYVSQRLRAQFELAYVLSISGRFTESVELGRKALAEADAAGLQGVAANGLVDLGNASLGARRIDDAEAAFARAAALAESQGARRTQMRATLARATARLAGGHPQEALDLSAEPLQFFSENHYKRFEIAAKGVVSRADGDLELYADGIRLATEVLAAAEAAGNDDLIATSLETRATQLRSTGRWPEALVDRRRLEQIHRDRKDFAKLPSDLANKAGLLIEMGQPVEALKALDEIDRGIESGIESYRQLGRRTRMLRALQLTIAGQFKSVAAAPESEMLPREKWDESELLTRALVEYGKAMLGRPGAPVESLEGWLADAHSPGLRRDLAYWLASIAAVRGATSVVRNLAATVLAGASIKDNHECRWRFSALGARSSQGSSDGASMRAQARADLQSLTASWGVAFAAYIQRPDLAALQRSAQ